MNHLTEVASLVASASAGDDPEVIAAAYLHDVVEDSHATAAEVESGFGARVRGLVDELTDDMTLSDEVRKRRQVDEIASRSADARLIKLADKISKVREMAKDPPADWSREKIAAYVAWCRQVVDAGCRGLDQELEAAFDRDAARAGSADSG